MNVHGIVILEGPDAAGKTTLARALVERFDGVYIHNRYHEYLWPFHAATLRWAARLSAGRLVVLDRHWVSEPVYARVFREGSKHAHNARSLYRVLVRFRALHVLCAPPVDAVVENFNRVKHLRPEQYDRVLGVAEAYRALWTGRDGPHYRSDEDFVEQLSRRGVSRMRSWMLFDYREHDVRHGLQRICDEIVQRVSELRVHAWPTALDYNHWAVAGNVAPDSVLLVGDKVNPNADAAAPWPFFTDRGSSDFLNRALHALRLDEHGLAIVDVNDDPFTAKWACLLCRRVVALGNNAKDALHELRVEPTAVVRHPQSARRFDYHARWQRPYYQELEEAIGLDAPTL